MNFGGGFFFLACKKCKVSFGDWVKEGWKWNG